MFSLLFLASLLSGVIDVHVHCAPDSVPRAIDAIDLAKLAKAAAAVSRHIQLRMAGLPSSRR